MKIKKTNLALFINNLKNNKFTINFTKKDGTERTMYCDSKTEYDLVPALDQPYLLVKSIFDDGGLRNINVNTVSGVVVGDDFYNVYA